MSTLTATNQSIAAFSLLLTHPQQVLKMGENSESRLHTGFSSDFSSFFCAKYLRLLSIVSVKEKRGKRTRWDEQKARELILERFKVWRKTLRKVQGKTLKKTYKYTQKQKRKKKVLSLCEKVAWVYAGKKTRRQKRMLPAACFLRKTESKNRRKER